MLVIEGLNKTYGQTRAVDNVSLEIKSGEFVGVIARSGAGKSTLLRMINRLNDPTTGSIRFGEVDVTKLQGRELREWRRRCAMIFQQFNLVGRLDVLNNVLMGRAALILLFAFPNIFPTPPGLSSLLGLPLLYLSMQMMLGRLPWLPAFIGEHRISRERFSQLVQKIAPYLARAEELLRSRNSYLVGHTAERPLGLLCFVLAVIFALPIPLENMLPALSMCLMSLGILERDGVWVSVGVVTGIISLIVVAAVVYTMIKAAIFVIINVLI